MEHNLTECENEQCRTCLTRPTELISLVADHVVCDKVMSVLDLIKTCTSVLVEVEDGLPQFVCLDCIRSAEKSFEFRVQCEQADTTLRSELTTMNIIGLSDNENVSNDMEIEYEVLDQEKTDLEFPELAVDRNEDEDDDNIEMEVERLDDEEDTDSEKSHDNKQVTIKCEELNLSEESEILEAYSCHVCNLIFPTPSALSKHSTAAHPPSFYQCPECPVRFISQHLLDKHVIKHSQNKNEHEKPRIKYHKRKRSVDYICAICGEKYTSMMNLQIHVRKHACEDQEIIDCTNSEQEQNCICNICEQQFTDTDDLQMHMETVHNLKSEVITQPDSDDGAKVKRKFGCSYCFKTFTSANVLQQHVEMHIEERKRKALNKSVQNRVAYKCKVCSHEVGSLPEIKDHLSTHSVDSKSIFQHLLYKCSECQLEFGTIYEYFSHMSSHAPAKVENTKGGVTRAVRKRPHACDEPGCDKAFPSPSALRSHAKTHQNQWPKKCRYCDDMMSKWNIYMTHLNQMHEEKKTYICSQCGKKFFKERNLQNHVRTHTGERNYMCDFCGFSFHAQNNLIAHRRIHTGVKPYKCTYCPQAFSQHAGLRSHLLNHTGEKKYECPTCHKKFLRIGAMKNHIKTHTGVKDYACHICGARFGASSTRKKHLLTHTGERNHVCDFCGKAFSRKSNLSVHIKIHTGETPHVCEVCGKGFIQAHVLRSHMNTHRKRADLGTTKRIVKSRKQVTINEEMKLESDDSQELPVLVELGD